MIRTLKQYAICGTILAAFAVSSATADDEKKKDRYDRAGEKTEDTVKKGGEATDRGVTKAGKATEKAADKTGDAVEKGMEGAGKGVGAAVEHTGRGVAKGAKATGGALETAGGAIKGLFTDDDDDRDSDRYHDRVKAAQRALQAKGYYGGPIDGVAGDDTRSGVREFQRDNNLAVTGRIDRATAEKLGID
ncbi:MAG: peptidoglycan-binding protein [Bryobacteraceae bacterium]|nr:peptidoglycan-binding protein [Bryobacteraceae bacterium]